MVDGKFSIIITSLPSDKDNKSSCRNKQYFKRLYVKHLQHHQEDGPMFGLHGDLPLGRVWCPGEGAEVSTFLLLAVAFPVDS